MQALPTLRSGRGATEDPRRWLRTLDIRVTGNPWRDSITGVIEGLTTECDEMSIGGLGRLQPPIEDVFRSDSHLGPQAGQLRVLIAFGDSRADRRL